MKKAMLYIISIVLVLFVFSFIKSVVGFIRLFKDQSNVQVFDKNYFLHADSLKVYNLRTNSDTVILLKGVQVFNFWAGWCKPCLDEIPGLQMIQERYPDLTVSLLSFDDTSSLNKKIKEYNIRLPAYFMNDSLVFQIPKVLPRTIVLKDNSVIRDMYVSRDWSLPDYTVMFDSLVPIRKDQ